MVLRMAGQWSKYSAAITEGRPVPTANWRWHKQIMFQSRSLRWSKWSAFPSLRFFKSCEKLMDNFACWTAYPLINQLSIYSAFSLGLVLQIARMSSAQTDSIGSGLMSNSLPVKLRTCSYNWSCCDELQKEASSLPPCKHIAANSNGEIRLTSLASEIAFQFDTPIQGPTLWKNNSCNVKACLSDNRPSSTISFEFLASLACPLSAENRFRIKLTGAEIVFRSAAVLLAACSSSLSPFCCAWLSTDALRGTSARYCWGLRALSCARETMSLISLSRAPCSLSLECVRLVISPQRRLTFLQDFLDWLAARCYSSLEHHLKLVVESIRVWRCVSQHDPYCVNLNDPNNLPESFASRTLSNLRVVFTSVLQSSTCIAREYTSSFCRSLLNLNFTFSIRFGHRRGPCDDDFEVGWRLWTGKISLSEAATCTSWWPLYFWYARDWQTRSLSWRIAMRKLMRVGHNMNLECEINEQHQGLAGEP